MKKVKQIVICSAGHSGSTLLDMVIGSHPKCESLGELTLLPMEFAMNRFCTCRQEIRSCPLWSQVAIGLGIDVVNDPYALNLGYIRAVNGDPKITRKTYSLSVKVLNYFSYLKLKYNFPLLDLLTPSFDAGIANSLSAFDLVRQLTGKEIVVDSSKRLVRAISLYRADPEHTQLILLVRDGRGVFYSSIKRGFGRRSALNAWKRYYEKLLPLLERYVPEQHVMLVKYEDFIMHTEFQCQKICDFLGIDFYPQMLNFANVVHHNVNGNDMRFNHDSKLQLDEKWKSSLSNDDRAYFNKYASSINRRFGYED